MSAHVLFPVRMQSPMRDASSKWGYIDQTGHHVIPAKFQMPRGITGWIDIDFSEGLAAGADGQKCGYVDRAGEYVIDPCV